MSLFKTVIALALAGAGVASPCAPKPPPTTTTTSTASKTASLTSVTHSVTAGLNGLNFDPNNVVANPGDIVEFLFLPKNHSVAQASFGKPCVPESETSFFSGFMPITDGLAPDVFQVVVEDTEPIWYYCAQTKNAHCQNGMVGVINQNFNSPNTLDAFMALAAKTNESVIPPTVQGGSVIANPNPGSGFRLM